MKVLLLDGYNLIYRARYSFQRGYNSTLYSFFRSLRPLIEKFDPDYAYFIVEGVPINRKSMFPEYKANRPVDNDMDFHRQKKEIISIMKEYFPLCVARHANLECDDVIAHMVTTKHREDECVVVSSDTDFIQLYNTCDNVSLYNPVKKSFVDQPDYDYLTWKSLRGDASDNIGGIPGIGNKRALNLVLDSEKLNNFLSSDKVKRDIFERNFSLIKFEEIDDIENIEYSLTVPSWGKVREYFDKMEFSSITNDKSWLKFQCTFDKLCA